VARRNLNCEEKERARLLETLISLSEPLKTVIARLRALPWDFEGNLVTLTARNLTSVLSRYIRGELQESDVENWANAIECRDAIGFEDGREGKPRECLHELANPLLTQPLTRERAQELIADLLSD